MKVAVNWSGGKDCCLACYYATQKGYEVSKLLNFTFTNYGRYTPVWVLKYLTMDIGKSTPRKISSLSGLVLRAAGRRFSRKLSKSLKTVPRPSTSTVATSANPVHSRRMVPHE